VESGGKEGGGGIMDKLTANINTDAHLVSLAHSAS